MLIVVVIITTHKGLTAKENSIDIQVRILGDKQVKFCPTSTNPQWEHLTQVILLPCILVFSSVEQKY